MKEKGQIFTWDLVFSTALFLILLLTLIFIWDNALVDIRLQEEDYEMNWLSKTVTKTLVMTPGMPVEWNIANVVVYGLAKTVKKGDTLSTLSHVVDPNKFIYFVYDATNNYEKTRRKLLSSSKYDYYVEISCLNESSVDCFQGLKFDAINFDIECTNQYVFTVTNYVTDTYRWVEAEDKWSNPYSETCTTPPNSGCSNGASSLIQLSPGPKYIETNPGDYNIWVRCFQDDNGFTVVVDSRESEVVCNDDTSKFEWSNLGTFRLANYTEIEFNRTSPGTEVDTLLLTTNPDYDPVPSDTLNYGNPNTIKNCVVGNYSEDIQKAVVSTQTASFGEPITELQLLSGSQPYLPRTIRIRTVIWKQGVSSTTPTTGPPGTSTTTLTSTSSTSTTTSTTSTSTSTSTISSTSTSTSTSTTGQMCSQNRIVYGGDNLVSFPHQITLSAQQLLNQIGPACTSVSRFDGSTQTWEQHVSGVPANNFGLEGGIGYDVYCTASAVMSTSGACIASKSDHIYVGDNLYGWVKAQTNSTAETELNLIGTDATSISRYVNDGTMAYWEQHIKGGPFSNFAVTTGEGYLIYSTSEYVWTR